MTGVLSKFVYDQGRRLGVTRLAVARGVYSAAILGYVVQVVLYPAIARRSRKMQEARGDEDEARKEALAVRAMSKAEEEAEEGGKKAAGRLRGPEVNREFFDRLRFLLK